MKATDHRTRVTRMLIRRAFTELLSRKPIQSISIKELCEAAGLNRSTFYAHYTDVYHLREQIEEEMLADFRRALTPLLSQKGADPVRITAGIFQCLKDNADVCTITLGPYGDKAFAFKLINLGHETCVGAYSAYFEHATARQIDYYYAFVSAGCIGLLQKWLADGMSASAEEMAAMAESIMRCGMGALGAEKK